MGDAGFFRGTSTEQDARFSDKMKKLSKTIKFPKIFSKKVDLKKVNVSVFRPWITRRISELLGVDDDIVIEFALSIIEQETCDPKTSQINLTGFLEKNAAVFMEELWELLLSAQENSNGIPTRFIEEKKEELRKKKIEEEKIARRIERERKIESEARKLARAKRQLEKQENEKGNEQKGSAREPGTLITSESRRSRSPPRYRSSRDESSRHERSYDRSRDYSSRREFRHNDHGDNKRDSYSGRREHYSHSSSHRTYSRRNRSRESSGSDTRVRSKNHERDSHSLHRDRRAESENISQYSRQRLEERRDGGHSRYNREEKVYSSDEAPQVSNSKQ